MPSYEKRESGLWSVRFTTYEGSREKTKRLSGYETKRAAKEAYEKFMSENIVQRKRSASPADNFSDLIVLYMAHERTVLKESSYNDYESRIKKHILPYFKDRKTVNIKPADILEWQHTIDGYSYKYKQNLRAILKAIFSFGSRYYDTQNPMDKVDGFRNLEGKREMQVWSAEEFKTFIDCVDDPVYHAFFAFLYGTGARRGEALALTPDDIDYQAREVNICKSLTFKTKVATYKITTTKNYGSTRKIFLPDVVLEELQALPPNAFLFGRYDKPLAENTITRKFKSYIKKSGVKEIRLHDLRHSHASLLISRGVSVVAVSKRLGHSTTDQTLKTYAHIMPSDTDAIRTALRDL